MIYPLCSHIGFTAKLKPKVIVSQAVEFRTFPTVLFGQSTIKGIAPSRQKNKTKQKQNTIEFIFTVLGTALGYFMNIVCLFQTYVFYISQTKRSLELSFYLQETPHMSFCYKIAISRQNPFG